MSAFAPGSPIGSPQKTSNFMNSTRTYAIPTADPWETWFVDSQLQPFVQARFLGGEAFFLSNAAAMRIIQHFQTLSRGESVVTAVHFDDVIPSSREKKLEIWFTILSFIDFNGDGRVEITEFLAYFIIRALRMNFESSLPATTNLRSVIPFSREVFQANILRAIEEFEAYLSHA